MFTQTKANVQLTSTNYCYDAKSLFILSRSIEMRNNFSLRLSFIVKTRIKVSTFQN